MKINYINIKSNRRTSATFNDWDKWLVGVFCQLKKAENVEVTIKNLLEYSSQYSSNPKHDVLKHCQRTVEDSLNLS